MITRKNPKLAWGFLLATGAVLYLKVWVPLTGIGVPCVFHRVTGLYCPGCGITRSLNALLQMNPYQAFRYNPIVFLLIPLFLVYTIAHKKNMNRLSRVLMGFMLTITLLFGFLRNLPAFHWLAPTIVD